MYKSEKRWTLHEDTAHWNILHFIWENISEKWGKVRTSPDNTTFSVHSTFQHYLILSCIVMLSIDISSVISWFMISDSLALFLLWKNIFKIKLKHRRQVLFHFPNLKVHLKHLDLYSNCFFSLDLNCIVQSNNVKKITFYAGLTELIVCYSCSPLLILHHSNQERERRETGGEWRGENQRSLILWHHWYTVITTVASTKQSLQYTINNKGGVEKNFKIHILL